MAQPVLKYKTKEFASVIMAIFCMLVIGIITSFVNAGLDPSKLASVENVTNMCLNASLTIFGIVSAIPLGITSTKQLTTPNGTPGRYIQEYNAYTEIRNTIEPRRPIFGQWHNAQHLIEQRQKHINYLLAHNIEQASDVLKLSKEQLLQLTTAQKFEIDGKEVYFKALTYEQIRACYKVLSGKVIVHKLPDFYFLYVDGKGTTTFYDQAYTQSKDNTIAIVSRLVYRIFIGFAITSIFTSLVITLPEDGITTRWVLKAVINVFARIFSALSSTFWGFQIGRDQVYRQCYYINGKTQFLKLFDADKDFKAKDVQELAKKDYECVKGAEQIGGIENVSEESQSDILGSDDSVDCS